MNRPTTVAWLLAAGLLTALAVPALGGAEAPTRLLKEEPKEKRQDLGTKEVGGYSVKVEQESAVKAGEEAAFVVSVTKGAGKPKAVRAWLGVGSAEGSVKAKGVPEGDELHCHVEVPKPLPEKSQFWVEVETASGKHKAGFDYR